jgi:hypothetical protein
VTLLKPTLRAVRLSGRETDVNAGTDVIKETFSQCMNRSMVEFLVCRAYITNS